MFGQTWRLLRDSVEAFIADDALSRGASISFYTATSIGPVLFIVVAIAGLAFGEDAARGAIASQLSGLMGRESADLVQTTVLSASGKSSGILASVVGTVTLLITASGVFGEMQSALNAIWKVKPQGTTVSRLVRARAASLGLVAALGFLLLVSLVISTILSGFTGYINSVLPFGALILHGLNFVISFALISVLFAAIYKVLPDVTLSWVDVRVGAVVTALLFEVGKFLIGLYLSHSAVASSYGAAGVLNGKVIGRCMQHHRHQEFICFLNAIEAAVPAGKLIHAIADSYATHKHPKVRAWLARHPRWTFHFTPTSASWLNAVEGFFAKLTRRRLKRGVFRSIVELQAAIKRFVAETNADPRPFRWTKDPDKIIAAVKRGHQVLDSIH